MKRKKARWDILSISINTRVKQQLIVKVRQCAINKVLVTIFVTVKGSQNANLTQSMSTQCSKTHLLQETIKYQTNELSNEYSN